MADTPEKKVKNKVRKIIKDNGGYSVMPVMRGMSENGTPDILACVGGYFLGIETKAGKGKPTKLQCVRLREIESAGGLAMVVNEKNLELFERLVINLANEGDLITIDSSFTSPYRKED